MENFKDFEWLALEDFEDDKLLFTFLASSLSIKGTQTLGQVDECADLLQFKESFAINKSVSTDPLAYPKVSFWMQEGDGNRSNCCSWDGVECDEDFGHVDGLDLRSSCLYGSINSSNTLFHLVHLQRLDLSDNHFNFSQIPSRFGHDLSSLTSQPFKFLILWPNSIRNFKAVKAVYP
ncbi:unnamed protein product [Prunus armeniaca]